MPKKERRCEHPYVEWDLEENRSVEKPCPHPYFGKGEQPWLGKEINCCIFHASMEEKQDHLGQFWFKFWRLFARVKRAAEVAETEEDNKNKTFQCSGFIFPGTGDRFVQREFPFSVNMRWATFSGAAIFMRTKFSGHADFYNAKFSGGAYFPYAQFSGAARFREVTFSDVATFWFTTFSGPADFTEAMFEKYTSFRSVSVRDSIIFGKTIFSKDADFHGASTEKLDMESLEPVREAVLFEHAHFYVPERVTIGGKTEEEFSGSFYKTDLTRWSFRGTNIEKIRFVEPCWPEEKARRGRKRTLDEERAEKGEISWDEAGEVYRKLRKNFEDNLAYEAAGDFHIGQMECRRRGATFLSANWILIRLYKAFSGYGESVGLPLPWLLGFFALFTGLFLVWTGFPAADGSAVDWVWGTNGMFSGEWWGQLWDGISFTLRSSVSFAVPRYAENVNARVGATLPALMFLWKVFAVAIGTFFVLALRRRFRR